MVDLEGSCIVKAASLSAASATLRVLTLATERTNRFDELMCAVGKLCLAFNILEHEIKTATCFLINPDNPDLSHRDIAKKLQINKRIGILKKHCVEKLPPEDQVRVNVMLDRVKDLTLVRNFPIHSLVYSSGDGEFVFHKYAEKLEAQIGTPEETIADVQRLQSWTAEFAKLFQEICPAYSSWFSQSGFQ